MYRVRAPALDFECVVPAVVIVESYVFDGAGFFYRHTFCAMVVYAAEDSHFHFISELTTW